MYIKRTIESTIRKADQTFDDPTLLAETMREPGLFFKNNKPPVVLDEVQYIAQLFPYIKMECDKRDERGLFALTGLQQYHVTRLSACTISRSGLTIRL